MNSNGIDNEKKKKVIKCTNELDGTGTTYYADAAKYWETVDPSVEGMLGGFATVSPVDLDGSSKLLKHLFKRENGPGRNRALDCGAGIGRISRNLLRRHFEEVDLVEQNPKFLDKAVEYLGSEHKGNLFCCGLQNFTPRSSAYDVIWCQWVLGHLTDEHLVDFLRRCSQGLGRNGVIVVKENMTSTKTVEFDHQDSSVTRSHTLLHSLFAEADLDVMVEFQQEKFPTFLFKVQMFALKPKARVQEQS